MSAAKTYSYIPSGDLCYVFGECRVAWVVFTCLKSTFWALKGQSWLFGSAKMAFRGPYSSRGAPTHLSDT
jgi:hypothetical protein